MIRRAIKRLIKRVLKLDPPRQPTGTPSSTHTPHSEPEAPSPDLSNMECGAQELRERLGAGEPVVIVDVREVHEFATTGIIEHALHIPLRELSVRWTELKDANEIVCYCAMGGRSYNAAMLLREKGLFNATSMEGGMTHWRAIGAPTVPWKET